MTLQVAPHQGQVFFPWAERRPVGSETGLLFFPCSKGGLGSEGVRGDWIELNT